MVFEVLDLSKTRKLKGMWTKINLSKLPPRTFKLRCYACTDVMDECDYGACIPFNRRETKDLYNVCIICVECFILEVEPPTTAKEYRESFLTRINKKASKLRDHYAEKEKRFIEQYNTEIMEHDRYFATFVENLKIRHSEKIKALERNHDEKLKLLEKHQNEKIKTIENQYENQLLVANMRASVKLDNLTKLNRDISDLNMELIDKSKLNDDLKLEILDLNNMLETFKKQRNELKYEFGILANVEQRMEMSKELTISGIARIRNEILEAVRKQLTSLNEPIINSITAEFKSAIEQLETVGKLPNNDPLCPVCLEQKKVNKLTCGHDICPDCWDGLLKNNIYRTYVPCPECRTEIQISEN